MTSIVLGYSAIALYLLGWIGYTLEIVNSGRIKTSFIQAITGLTIILHGFAIFGLLFQYGGLDLSLLKILALLALVINSLVFLNGLREPINSLYLILFPISAITLILALASPSTKSATVLPYSLQAHILTSVLAYSFLAIAALHALLAGYQNWQLKHKHQNALMRTLPALRAWKSYCLSLFG